jgi:uncharacterized protein (TIGR02266 family)
MTRPGTHEKRVHPRVSLEASVDFNSGSNFFTGQAKDISVGGLFLETPAAVQVGMPLMLRLEILNKKLNIEAEVTWVMLDGKRQVGIGARFLKLAEADRKHIEAFMVFREPMRFEMELPEPEPEPDENGW